MSSTTAMHGDAVRIFSSVFIIAQSDIRKREYLIIWLQKKSLKQLLFEWGTFSEFLRTFTFWKELVFLFYNSLLPFSTFANCKVLTERLLHNICPCFHIVFAHLGVILRARNKFVEIVAAAEHYLIITHIKKYRIKEAVVPNMSSCNNTP